jgi:hypothetical protein
LSGFPSSSFDPHVEGDNEPLLPWTRYDADKGSRPDRLRERVEALMAEAEESRAHAARLVAAVIYLEYLREIDPQRNDSDPEVVAEARRLIPIHGLRPN